MGTNLPKGSLCSREPCNILPFVPAAIRQYVCQYRGIEREPSNLSTREKSLVERRVDLDRYFSGAYGLLGSRYHLPISCQTAIRKPLSIAPLSQSISLTRATFHSFFLPSDLDLLFICCPYIFRQSPRRATPS